MVTQYIPFDVEPKFPCTGIALYDLRHSYIAGCDGNPLTAYFVMPGAEKTLLKIGFSHVDIIRVQDEVFLWTEENGEETTGLVRHHFAYRVKNSRFWNSQSEFYKDLRTEAVHYRFITSGACLDVLTMAAPKFEVTSNARMET